MLATIPPATGKILISEPFMADPDFKRSVVFLVEHGEEGTVGFVLNQETQLFLNDVIAQFPDFGPRLQIGGPVQPDTLHYIHREARLGGVEVMPGVFWGGSFDILKELIDAQELDPSHIRFYIGYSGWSPGQLEEELKNNSWIVSSISMAHLFSDDYEDFWKETVRSLGNRYAHIANFPENPNLN